MSLHHQIVKLSSRSSYKAFEQSLKSPVETQKEKLSQLGLKNHIDSYPLSTYKDFEGEILQGRLEKSGPFAFKDGHFEPTSGSTSEVKWIPYNKAFKAELDAAASPWLYDLYGKFPKIAEGKHYWSLSWLPDDLRKSTQNDDAEALPWYKSYLLKKIMITDPTLQKLPTSREFLKESLARMLEMPVSLISVWSPTFLLKMLDLLEEEKDWFHSRFKRRDQGELVELLKEDNLLSHEALGKLFPKLQLISAWESGTSEVWAKKVKNLFPEVSFQGKGLWATEGVVTIPFQEKYPLAVRSHYYEFYDPADKKIVPFSGLEKGRVVQPVLTTGSGFIRYHLEDNLLVKEFLHKTPCFEFLGRSRHMDIAGEKLSFEVAEKIMGTLKEEFPVEPICFVAQGFKKGGGYGLLLSQTEGLDEEALAGRVEELLQRHHHYKLARDLGQLNRAVLLKKKNPLEYYYQVCKKRIGIEGNIKPEPIVFFEDIQ